tara:strand:- start:2714 stop:4063 length:1350 start_codon:yes stop_codon:yes gene_type:complete
MERIIKELKIIFDVLGTSQKIFLGIFFIIVGLVLLTYIKILHGVYKSYYNDIYKLKLSLYDDISIQYSTNIISDGFNYYNIDSLTILILSIIGLGIGIYSYKYVKEYEEVKGLFETLFGFLGFRIVMKLYSTIVANDFFYKVDMEKKIIEKIFETYFDKEMFIKYIDIETYSINKNIFEMLEEDVIESFVDKEQIKKEGSKALEQGIEIGKREGSKALEQGIDIGEDLWNKAYDIGENLWNNKEEIYDKAKTKIFKEGAIIIKEMKEVIEDERTKKILEKVYSEYKEKNPSKDINKFMKEIGNYIEDSSLVAEIRRNYDKLKFEENGYKRRILEKLFTYSFALSYERLDVRIRKEIYENRNIDILKILDGKQYNILEKIDNIEINNKLLRKISSEIFIDYYDIKDNLQKRIYNMINEMKRNDFSEQYYFDSLAILGFIIAMFNKYGSDE